MDAADQFGTGEVERLETPISLGGAEIVRCRRFLLKRGPHGAVEDEYLFAQGAKEGVGSLAPVRGDGGEAGHRSSSPRTAATASTRPNGAEI